ncbi:hypothetical protein [Piscinibacter terrae]|uniref:Uncharacterized protein n=1 Tax=Piscinibacter terrae TaxID=2496871 RepID=A0A3N7HHJ5_9BURK|nr:hypothetical protein [Albitalea terrae]RQP21488.1 hypothetical protein DZC73_26575 [Albitalea terrae]
MARPINMVFSAGVTPEQALKRVQDAAFTLFRYQLAPFRHAKQDTFGNTTVDRWEQEGRRDTAIDLTSDRAMGVSFVSVIAGDDAHAHDVATKLNDMLMLRPAQEFIDIALRQPDDPAALVRAALAAEQEHAGLKDAIAQRLGAADVPVRAAAAKAAALVTWPSLLPALQKALAGETDPTLHRFLEIAVKKCGGST